MFSSLPNGMDIILKKYFDKYRSKNCLPPEIEGKLNGRLFADMEKLKVWRNNFKGLQYLDEESGIILKGALDDLFVNEDGSHIPLDFKTRGFPLNNDNNSEYYQDQMNVYCFLLDKNNVKTGDFACLIFYYPIEAKDNGNFKFECDVIKLKTSKENGNILFKEAIEVLKGPEPDTNENCPWCNWNQK